MRERGNPGTNAMQLIMDLENKCRDLAEDKKRYQHKYWLALVRRELPWWLGVIIGVLSTVVFCIWIRWLPK